MKFNASTLIWVFIWSIFMGITVGSIGIGAIFPPANLIAKPFVCPAGEMQLETQGYNVSPVETVTTLTWYCSDPATGVREELGIFPMSLYAGAIYGLLLFAVIALVLWFRAFRASQNPGPARTYSGQIMEHLNQEVEESRRIRQQAEEFQQRAGQFREQAEGLKNLASRRAKSPVDKMKELQELRDSNLISETEYEQKRKEILKEL